MSQNQSIPDGIKGTVEADRAARRAPGPLHKVLGAVLKPEVGILRRDSRDSGDAGIIAVPGPDGRTVRYLVMAVPLGERKRSRTGKTENVAGAGFRFAVLGESRPLKVRVSAGLDIAAPAEEGIDL